ncbi:thiamine pyrophosphate-binding protein [Spirillospora sp. NBC_00431]
MRYTGGQAIAEHLVREGVTTMFAIPGHGNTALLDAFVERRSEIDVIPAMHEQGASHMADGYYRATGDIAAVCVTIGPGATNTLTGVATAFADSCPQLVITGGVHTYLHGRGVLQEINRTHDASFPRVAEPIVKRWWQPGSLRQFPLMLDQAFRTMREGRKGPVLLDVPQDLQAESADLELIVSRPDAVAPPRGDARAVERAAELLLSAERPVIVAGGGVIAAKAAGELRALAEHLGIPVTVSFMGKGAIAEDHPLYAEPCGDMGSFSGNAMTREADVVLGIGCRFSDRVSSSYRDGITFDPSATTFIQIDIDQFELGRNYPVEVGIAGDAKLVLADLLAAVREHRPAPADLTELPRLHRLQRLKAEWHEHLRPMRTSDRSPMTISRVLAEARAVLPRDGVLVTDSSNPQNQAYNEFPVYEPGTHITAGGFSGIGFAIPAAIGVGFGARDRAVLCLCGDGSFLQTGQELAVAAMYDLPVVFLVVNNGGWEAIKNLQLNLFGADREMVSGFRHRNGDPYQADLAAFARSLGVAGERVDRPGDLAPALRRAFASGKPAVVEAMCAREYPWSGQHPTGWWDITVPEYLTGARAAYVEKRGF